MQWQDIGFIIGQQKHGDSSAVVTCFTEHHGVQKAYVKGMMSKQKRGVFQLGNLLDITWQGRLVQQLGAFQAEMITPYASFILHDRKKLLALSSLCHWLNLFPEGESHPGLLHEIVHFLEQLRQGDEWQVAFIRLEIRLLNYFGYALDLSCCAATGTTEDLHYISPKSGQAVSQKAGEPYKNKLFLLPGFLLLGENSTISPLDIKNGLALSGYFLHKYVLKPYGYVLPKERSQLEQLLST